MQNRGGELDLSWSLSKVSTFALLTCETVYMYCESS